MEHPSQTGPDRVEELLAGLLELDEGAQVEELHALCGSHPELAEELREHFALFRRLVDEPAADEEADFGDYRLIRPLGSGGMGVVWLARQRRGGVDRTVALKMVRGGGLQSPEARERFRREARAAFRVEHPGICPVYDVGEIDGTPYLAMRYVPGRTLAELIEEARREHHELQLPDEPTTTTSTGRGSRHQGHRPLDALLELVESVAHALHAAHEAGLVHRDVKPANVMVTPTGEPVLLDFGLVHDTDNDSSLTLSGQPLGTPAYMAPEQISPRGRKADRTVDVYGLGATLYECVTLQPPFRAETREGLYRGILEHEPRPASKITHSVPKNLDAILETALRKEPNRRYHTALEFAEDLGALRRHEPVRARATGPLLRTLLWTRRNPFATTILLLLAVALAFALVQGRDARHSAETARAERDRAERGFDLAREAIEELVHTARSRLRDVPRMQSVRSALLDRALEFHEDLATELGDDPSVLVDVIRAWEAVTDLQLELGRVEHARGALEHAVAAAEEQQSIRPDIASRYDHARVTHLQGLVARAGGQLAEAERAFARARQQFLALEQAGPTRGVIALASGRALSDLASVLHASGRSEEALNRIDEAEAAYDRALERGEVASTVAKDIARSASLRARVARDLQRFDDAERAFQASLETLRALIDEDPRDRSCRYELTAALIARSRMRTREGRLDEALRDDQEALEIVRALFREHPESTTYAGTLATAWNNRYVILMKLERRDDAAASLREALDLIGDVVAAKPNAHDAAEDLGTLTINLGNLARRTDGPSAALPHYERAVEILVPLARAHPDNVKLVRRAASAAESAAISHILTGRPEQADPLLALARRLAEALVERAPNDPRALRDLGRIRFNEAARLFDDDKPEAAAEALRACLPLRDRLADSSPTNLRLQHDSLLTRARLATALRHVDATAAEQVATESLARAEGLAPEVRQRMMGDSSIRSDLGTLCVVAAEGRARAGDRDAELELLESGWTWLWKPVQGDQTIGWARIDTLLCAVMLAEGAHRDHRTDDLARHLQHASQLIAPLTEQAPLAGDVRRELLPRLERLERLCDGRDDELAASLRRDITLARDLTSR